jgi:hypothetical protein
MVQFKTFAVKSQSKKPKLESNNKLPVTVGTAAKMDFPSKMVE